MSLLGSYPFSRKMFSFSKKAEFSTLACRWTTIRQGHAPGLTHRDLRSRLPYFEDVIATNMPSECSVKTYLTQIHESAKHNASYTRGRNFEWSTTALCVRPALPL